MGGLQVSFSTRAALRALPPFASQHWRLCAGALDPTGLRNCHAAALSFGLADLHLSERTSCGSARCLAERSSRDIGEVSDWKKHGSSNRRARPPGIPAEEVLLCVPMDCCRHRQEMCCQVPAFVRSAAPHPGHGCVGVVLVAQHSLLCKSHRRRQRSRVRAWIKVGTQTGLLFSLFLTQEAGSTFKARHDGHWRQCRERLQTEAEAGKLWPTVSEHCLYNFFKRVRRPAGQPCWSYCHCIAYSQICRECSEVQDWCGCVSGSSFAGGRGGQSRSFEQLVCYSAILSAQIC